MDHDPFLLRRLPAFPPPAPSDHAPWLEALLANGKRRLARTLPEELEPVRPGVLEPPRALPEGAPDPKETFLQEFWGAVQAERELTLEASLPERVRIGWRIVREMARLKNICGENELLIEALPAEPDPWSTPCPFNKPSSPADIQSQKRYMVPLWDVVEIICADYDGKRNPGLPLLPPPVPEQYVLEDGDIHPDYDPYRDTRLIAYLKAARRIVDHYAMEWKRDVVGAAAEDPRGRAGVAGLLHPVTCRRAWPTRSQVIYFESMLIEETISQCALGRSEAAIYLAESYGLREREVRSVLATAATELRGRYDMDIEEKRALLVARLEHFVGRARGAFDLNNEMKALKVLAVVEGLTRTEPEDANKQFLEVTHRIAAGAKPSEGPELAVIEAPVKEIS